MQTENKKEQYIEPIGFKGTKYEWRFIERDNPKESTIPFGIEALPNHIMGVIPVADICNFPPISKGVTDGRRYDAQLISQSKELAKALQDMITWQYCYEARSHEEREAFDACIKNAKQVLKDAGLIDK